ncbi:MAG: HEAT repeat domain-containing protein [Cyanobacteria bacterium J06643_5]
MDLLVVWGVAQAAGFVFKPILEELSKDLGNIVKDAAKDWTKDLFKGIPRNAFKRLQKQDIDIAAGKALKEFLLLVQRELEDAEIEDEELKQFVKPFKTFIHNKDVKEILGSTFKYECETLDTNKLEIKWYELNLPVLPSEYDWKRIGKRYLKKVKAIIHDSDKLRVILDSQNIEAIKNNTQETAGIIPAFDLLGYQEAIKETYGKLKLESLDTTGYAYNELKLWGMFIAQNVREVHEVVPKVHELPKEHLKRLQESEQAESEIEAEDLERFKRIYFEQPISSVLEIINETQNYKYIVILGDPGSGKSTLLQYLALNWAESPLNNSISQPIPLLIELRTYMRRRDEKECNNFLEFFHRCSGVVHHLNQHQLQAQLKAGNAKVMFDGLDEVFEAGKREDVITDIHRFTNEYPNVQVIVTSRVIGYKPQRLRDAEFKHFILEDLETEQIQDFIYRWHELTFSDEADKSRKKERLQKGIDNSKAIAELAGNPLLLTMMAILNRNQELPRDRAELYNQASRVLLHQWDVERTLIEDKRLDPKTIDYKDKQSMLRQVAYFMQTSEKGLAGNLIKECDLERILKNYLKTIEVDKAREAAKLMINQLRTRNFMLCYLGADYYAFVHRTFLEYFCAWEFVWQFKETQTLSIEQLKIEVFGKHWMDESWHEVLKLIAGMIEAKFVGEIIEFLMEIDGEEERFKNLFLAAECLGEVRNRKVILASDEKLFSLLKNLSEYQKDIKYLAKHQWYVGKKIGTKAISIILNVWKDDEKTIEWLKTIVNHTRYWAVSRLVSQELVKRHVDIDDFQMLINLAQFSNNLNTRVGAIIELAERYKHEPKTLEVLKQCIQNDSSWRIRREAIYAMYRGWNQQVEMLLFLKNIALYDDARSVRRTAIDVISRWWKKEPEIIEFLCDRAKNDPCKIHEYWLNPRYAALEAILEHYPNHPKTLPLLRDRAKNDPDEELREVAQKKLQEWNSR